MKKKKKNNRNQQLRIIKLRKNIFDGVPLKDYVASQVIFRFCARKKNQVTDDAKNS